MRESVLLGAGTEGRASSAGGEAQRGMEEGSRSSKSSKASAKIVEIVELLAKLSGKVSKGAQAS